MYDQNNIERNAGGAGRAQCDMRSVSHCERHVTSACDLLNIDDFGIRAVSKGTNTGIKFVDKKGESVPLGIITKCHAIVGTQGLQQIPLKDISRIYDHLLQAEAGKILGKMSRVSYCGKRKIDKSLPRGVVYNYSREKAHFNNVQRCGSVWNCKCCAKKITETRKNELALANEQWKNGVTRVYFDWTEYDKSFVGPIIPSVEYIKGYTYLLTLTNSHNAGHRLDELLLGQKRALKRFFEGRKGRDLFARLSKRYHITNYENTYGQNGWHPHHHILIFSDKYLSINEFSELEKELSEFWLHCCVKSNLPAPSIEHGLTLRDGTYADQYIGKWGIEHEMTKGHIKQGREGGLTPFDLLDLSAQGQEVHGRSPAKLFKEYSEAFYGKAQLSWSRGLKDLFGLRDKSDDQIIDEAVEDAVQIETIEDMAFDLLTKYKKIPYFLIAFEADMKNKTDTAQKLIYELVNIEMKILKESLNI